MSGDERIVDVSNAAEGRDDARFMGLAIALGSRNLGLTWPNPSVGAVLVEAASGAIISTGVTQAGGRPHAERVALAAAGTRAEGAILYVSLEPCSHHGKTPPCTDAIIASGVSRVVTPEPDPDPRVAGRGHELLRAAGVEVVTGVARVAASRANRGHICRVTHGRPWLTLKIARTSDGDAGMHGQRLLITGEPANARTHMRRAHSDAVMVGIGTVIADDPRLNVRLPGMEDRSPRRVVVDSRLRIPVGAALVATARSRPASVVCTEAAPVEAERRLRDAGVEVIRVGAGTDGRVDLAAALAALGERGITRVLCEGGPHLADALATADLADDVILITASARAPQGGSSQATVPALGPALTAALGTRLRPVAYEVAGPDLIETYERT